MSTQINVTVDSGGLRQRDKQQRHALRLGKLESDNQRKVEAKAKQEREAAQPPPDAVYGVPFATPSKREEPAAFRQGVGPAFLLICNVNTAKDDIFEIRVRRNDQEAVLQKLADFSVDDEKTTYLYLQSGSTYQQYQSKKPYDVLQKHLDDMQKGTPPYYVEPMGLLAGQKPQKGAEYEIAFINKQNNNNGNYGYLMAGYINTATYWFGEWDGNSGADIIVSGVKWGETNEDMIDRYPSEYFA